MVRTLRKGYPPWVAPPLLEQQLSNCRNRYLIATPALGPPTPALGPPTPALGPPTPALGPPTPALGPPTPALGPPTPGLIVPLDTLA